MAWPRWRWMTSSKAQAKFRPISIGASCRRVSGRPVRTRRRFPPHCRPSCAITSLTVSPGCRGSPISRWEACLADDMGLGKTVQTIAVMLEQQLRGACLVVAPTSVCHNWESELARFAPTLNVYRLAAAQDRASQIEVMGPGDVLIASYGLLHQEDEALTKRAWNMSSSMKRRTSRTRYQASQG